MSTKRKQKEIVGFTAWFEAQFGGRPLTSEQEGAATADWMRGQDAKVKLRALDNWKHTREAALTAWLAKERGQK